MEEAVVHQPPEFDLEGFFEGRTRAWGLVEDRFGKLRRQFAVTIEGTREDGRLVLDERFAYDDGETDRRVWRIERLGRDRYRGRADDILGAAEGRVSGNMLSWSYAMKLRIGGHPLRVRFDDRMYLQEDGVLLNRARISKFGLELAEVTLAFTRG